MKIWICIPVFNRVEYTLKCLASLQAQTYRDFIVVICDHGSVDGTSQIIRAEYPDVIVLQESSELWWAGATNRCVEYALNCGDLLQDAIVTLNNDLEVDCDYLSNLVSAATRHPNSIITSAGFDIHNRLLVAPGLRQNWYTSKVSVIYDVQDRLPDDINCAEVTHAPGRGTFIPLQIFSVVGLFDEKHLPHYGADYDFTHRARRAGFRILISFCARIYSYVEATGMSEVRREFNIQGFARYLTDMKSPANLSARWWLAVKNCPRILLPSFLMLDLCFVICSYFKFHMMKAIIGHQQS